MAKNAIVEQAMCENGRFCNAPEKYPAKPAALETAVLVIRVANNGTEGCGRGKGRFGNKAAYCFYGAGM